VLTPGLTVNVCAVDPPGCQEYVVAPDTLSVVVAPEQIVLDDAVTVSEGTGFTVTATVEELIHPLLSVPLTVYVREEAGVTVTLVVVAFPAFASQV
jgi:hypothetical protein